MNSWEVLLVTFSFLLSWKVAQGHAGCREGKFPGSLPWLKAPVDRYMLILFPWLKSLYIMILHDLWWFQRDNVTGHIWFQANSSLPRLILNFLCLVGLGVNQPQLNQINLKSNLTCNIKFISKVKKYLTKFWQPLFEYYYLSNGLHLCSFLCKNLLQSHLLFWLQLKFLLFFKLIKL